MNKKTTSRKFKTPKNHFLTLKCLALVLATALAGCSSIRMEYEGEITTQDGKKAFVKAEKSYKIPSHHSTMCGITGIFAGGYCWFYLVMPTTQQRSTMESEVKSVINEKLKSTNYELVTIKNNKKNWKYDEDSFLLEFSQKNIFKNSKIKE